jgi:branched-chain amino acid transport system substrate-binding protein
VLSHPRHGSVTGGILILTVALLAALSGCSSKTSGTTAGTTSTTASAAALGTPNKATGTPIKVGFVSDGKTASLDSTSQIAASKAAADYVNAYLGGVNGHPLVLDVCDDQGTPSGTTTCGTQMLQDKVAAVLVSSIANDQTLFDSLNGTIPYMTYTAASEDILLKPTSYVLTNPVGLIGAPALIAQSKGIKKAADVIIDVPAATGPITAIAKPLYAKANVSLDIVPISPSVADQTPQLQQVISSGAGLITVTGDEPFITKSLKALKELDFKGPIVIGTTLSSTSISSIPGGVAGVTLLTSNTTDPSNAGVQTFHAVMAKYAASTELDAYTPWGYAVVVSFQKALAGAASDPQDAASINKVLSAMPKPIEAPLGDGATFQCGVKLVPITPNACTLTVLQATMDKTGAPADFKAIDTSSLFG